MVKNHPKCSSKLQKISQKRLKNYFFEIEGLKKFNLEGPIILIKYLNFFNWVLKLMFVFNWVFLFNCPYKNLIL